MTEAQFLEGLQYAEDNLRNEEAPHLKLDKELIRSRFELNGKQVLDFGCGMGGMTLWYASNWACEVHGVDIDGHHIQIAMQLAQKHPDCKVTFEKRDILEKPLEHAYDLIFMNDVAEHVPLVVLQQIFHQFKKNLAPGGKLVITYPPWKSPYASHLNQVIKIPWIQFFPKILVDWLIDRHNQVLVGDLEGDLRSAYDGLNRLTHQKLYPMVKQAGFEIASRKSHTFVNNWLPLKNLNLRFFPFDYLITKELLELSHAQEKSE